MAPRRKRLTTTEAKVRRAEATKMRTQLGISYRTIAEKHYYGDVSNCYKDIQKALDEAIREPAEMVLAMELERLDQMLLAMMPKVIQEKDTKAAGTILSIMDRRAKYLGLDKPTQIEQSGGDVTVVLHPSLGATGMTQHEITVKSDDD